MPRVSPGAEVDRNPTETSSSIQVVNCITFSAPFRFRYSSIYSFVSSNRISGEISGDQKRQLSKTLHSQNKWLLPSLLWLEWGNFGPEQLYSDYLPTAANKTVKQLHSFCVQHHTMHTCEVAFTCFLTLRHRLACLPMKVMTQGVCVVRL